MSARAVAELRAEFDQPFWMLGSNATRDGTTVVASWPSLPVELVHAAQLLPVFARGRNEPTPAADRVLEPDLFPNRLRQLVDAALTGRLSGVAAVLLPRSSDPDYKCFLYLRELVRRGTAPALPPVLLFDLLHSRGTDVCAYNADRTRALAARLGDLAGRRVGPDDVARAIERSNRARAAARRLQSLRAGTPRIAGSDALPLLGAFWQMEPARYAALAHDAADEVARQPPPAGPRVALAGSPVDGTALHLGIEAAGGVVVAEPSGFTTCTSELGIETVDDPLGGLAEHYRRESLDARRQVDASMSDLERLLDGVDAVVVSLPPDDASFGWDFPRIRDLLATRSIPHTVLRGDPVCGVGAADLERIRALLARSRARPEASHG